MTILDVDGWDNRGTAIVEDELEMLMTSEVEPCTRGGQGNILNIGRGFGGPLARGLTGVSIDESEPEAAADMLESIPRGPAKTRGEPGVGVDESELEAAADMLESIPKGPAEARGERREAFPLLLMSHAAKGVCVQCCS